ncbi:MAG: orotate phosphoribosyltransferase [Spirochaetota bacterium]
MSELSQIREELFAISLELGAVRLDMSFPFRWASGYMMPIYNDSRLFLSSPRARALIAQGLEHLLEGQKVEHIAGVATGGIAHAVLLAERLQLPMQYIRSQAKSHGLLRQVEGLPQGGYNGERVALIEDVSSTGGSALQAAHALEQSGANVLGCFTVYSYAFGKTEMAFAEASLPLRSILSFPQLLNFVAGRRLFRSGEIEQLRAWHKNPFTRVAH